MNKLILLLRCCDVASKCACAKTLINQNNTTKETKKNFFRIFLVRRRVNWVFMVIHFAPHISRTFSKKKSFLLFHGCCCCGFFCLPWRNRTYTLSVVLVILIQLHLVTKNKTNSQTNEQGKKCDCTRSVTAVWDWWKMQNFGWKFIFGFRFIPIRLTDGSAVRTRFPLKLLSNILLQCLLEWSVQKNDKFNWIVKRNSRNEWQTDLFLFVPYTFIAFLLNRFFMFAHLGFCSVLQIQTKM